MTLKYITDKIVYHDSLENRQTIIDICAAAAEITREQMLSKCRERTLCLARAIAAKIMRERMRYTLKQIGTALGAKNVPKHHTTIIHYLEIIDDLLHIRDGEAVTLYNEVILRLSKAMTHGTRVLVYIPDADEGELLRHLDRMDYRHEIVE